MSSLRPNARDPGADARARRVELYRAIAEAGLDIFTGEAHPAPVRPSWTIVCGHCDFATPCVRGEPPPAWRTFVLGCGTFVHECAACSGLWDERHGSPHLAFGVRQPGRSTTPDEALRAKRRKGAA